MNSIKMVITDLDGTLLTDDKRIAQQDSKTLKALKERGVVNAVATGRNLTKVKEVLPAETAIDYVIFSSGAGIYDWQQQQLINACNMPADSVHKVIDLLEKQQLSFFLFDPVPENHRMLYRRNSRCAEFEYYLHTHRDDAKKYVPNLLKTEGASQFLVIVEGDESGFEALQKSIHDSVPGARVIRSTSQHNEAYIWVEVFNDQVSKGHGVAELCAVCGVPKENTLSIGNDYNDVEMLDFTQYAYIMANAPDVLKNNGYRMTRSNREAGVSTALENHFDL